MMSIIGIGMISIIIGIGRVLIRFILWRGSRDITKDLIVGVIIILVGMIIIHSGLMTRSSLINLSMTMILTPLIGLL